MVLEKEIEVEVVNELKEEDFKEVEEEGNLVKEPRQPSEIWRIGDAKYRGYAPYIEDELTGIYLAKRWSWRQKQQAMFNATQVVNKEKGLMQYDVLDSQMWQVIYCITPPEGVILNEAFMENIDVDLGSILFYASQVVNGLSLEEQNRFLGLTEPVKDTPG